MAYTFEVVSKRRVVVDDRFHIGHWARVLTLSLSTAFVVEIPQTIAPGQLHQGLSRGPGTRGETGNGGA